MRTILSLALGVLVVPVVSCSPGADRPDDGRLDVVTSFYPLMFAAEGIGGSCVDVTNLTPPGVEPHDLELSPDRVEAIATADIVFYLGGGFQPAIEDAVGDIEGRAIDLLRSVETVQGSEEGEEGTVVDPHVWLDPVRFATIAGSIADALGTAGARDGCDVDARASALGEELTDVNERFRAGLADCDLDVIVTTHSAFGYLAERYGLTQEAIAGIDPEAEPSAKRLAELEAFVRREGVTTIFTEELVSPEVAETLAEEAGVDTAVLSTIEGLTEPQAAAGRDYVSLMEENLGALRSALRCR